MQPEYVDALVVGSGPAGSVAALRLGEAGYSTVVLERGKRWDMTSEHNTFATYEKPDGRSAWLSPMTVDPIRPDVPIETYTGVLDRVDGEGISVLLPACLGGGSILYNGAMVQPSQEQFSRILPMCDYHDFRDVYYPRVRQVIPTAPLPLDMLTDPHFESSRLFRIWVERAGWHTSFEAMAMNWEIVRQELSGKRIPHVTSGFEQWYGDNSGAKQSLDKNYLRQAEKLETVDILPLHEVTQIEVIQDTNDRECYLVSGRRIDTTGKEQETFSFLCSYLFVAAGAFKTSELMVKARETGALPRLSMQVGKGFGNNGDAIGIHRGHQQESGVPQVAASIGFTHALPEYEVRILGDALNGGPTDALLTLSMAMPTTRRFPNKGEFRYDTTTGRVQLSWPYQDSEIQTLYEAVGSTYTLLDRPRSSTLAPSSTQSIDIRLTAHPLGGMVLGEACANTGCVYGYENLYVLDGSLLPGAAGCANPFLTIAALAEYIMDQFLSRTDHPAP